MPRPNTRSGASIPTVTRSLARPQQRRSRSALQHVAQPLVATALVLALHTPGAEAAGLEAIDLPFPSAPNVASKVVERSNKALQDAENAFQNSDLLASLRENSDANRDKNKRAIEEKYCQRQGEMGVGDCGGLRFIPGATKGGKQRTPAWLAGLFGIQQDEEETFEFSMTAPRKEVAAAAPAMADAEVAAAPKLADAAAGAAQVVADVAPDGPMDADKVAAAVANAAPDAAAPQDAARGPATTAADDPPGAGRDTSQVPPQADVPKDPEVQEAVKILEQNDEPPKQIAGVLDAIESP